MKDYATKTGKELKVTPESMVKAIKSGSVKFVATEMPFIKTVVEKTEFYAKVFSELNVRILISPSEVGFILSDNPVTVVPHPSLSTAGVKSGDSGRCRSVFRDMPITHSGTIAIMIPG
jgi:hypothetical protein